MDSNTDNARHCGLHYLHCVRPVAAARHLAARRAHGGGFQPPITSNANLMPAFSIQLFCADFTVVGVRRVVLDVGHDQFGTVTLFGTGCIIG